MFFAAGNGPMAGAARLIHSNLLSACVAPGLRIAFVLLCVSGGSLLPHARAWAKEEVRAQHWRWGLYNAPQWGSFESPEAVRQAWNQDQEQKYAACIADTCNSCNKIILGPMIEPSLSNSAKINGQFTWLRNVDAVGTSIYTECNGKPAQGPTITIGGPFRAAVASRYCPPGFGARNSPAVYEVIDGVEVPVYNSECFKELPDPPQCSKVKETDTRCGNPIDAMNESKIEVDTDYVSSDGLLRVTRSYSSAIGRWSWGHRATLVDLTGRGTGLPVSTGLIANVKIIPPGVRDTSIPAINLPVPFPLIKSHTSGPMVWLMSGDGRRTAFTETASDVFSTSSLDKPQLGIVAVGSSYRWRLKSPAGSFQIFSTAGDLVQEAFADGKSLHYTYAGNAFSVTAMPGGRQIVYSRSNDDVPQGKYDIVTLPDGSELRYAFNTAGMVASVTYADGRSKTYVYDEPAHAPPPSLGGSWIRLTGLLDENNARFGTYTYDTEAPIATEHANGINRYAFTYFSGRTEFTRPPLDAKETVRWAMGPDGERRVTSRQQPAGAGSAAATTTLTYDVGGYVASVVNFNGNRTCYSNDQTRGLEIVRLEGLATNVSCPANIASHNIPTNTRQRKISTQWHPAWNFPVATARPKLITRWVYNGQADPTTGTTASCAPAVALLPDGSPIAVVCKKIEQATTDVTGTTGFSALSTGAPRSWSYTYNSFGQVLTVDGPRDDVSDVTTYTYYDCDTGYECGQIHTVTNAANQTTTYNTYNAHGQPLSISDPTGVVTTLTYDSRQRLKSRTVGSEYTSFDYWPTGLLKKATLPDGSYLEYTYDAAHRLTDIHDMDGNRVHYTLDTAGNRTKEEFFDPSSNTPTQTRGQVFDALSRLHQEIGAAGSANVTTTYAYDKNGNQTGMAAPLGRDTVQAYDELNRLTQVTDPLNGITNYGYDALDQLISVTDPKRLVTSYEYNGLGDLTKQISPDTGITTNTHDGGGNLQTSTDARNVVTTYTYDELNRVETASFALGGTVDQTLVYSYDAGPYGAGRLTGVSDADHSLGWTYDEQGRVSTTTQTVGSVSKTTGYSYLNGLRQSMTTPSGQLISYGYANGRITSVSVSGTLLVSDVMYEPFGPVRQWTWGNSTLSVRTFDGDGKISQIDSAGLKTYAYDDAFRITDITDASDASLSWHYDYDDLDRLASASSTGTTLGYEYDANGNRRTQTGSDASTFTIAPNSNRLTSTSGALTRTYGYDDAGNTTNFDGVTFTYNNRGRMKSSTKNGVTTNYTYNALGQLIKRGASALYYYDDAGHVLGVYDSSGALTEEIVWLGDIPLATLRPKAGGGVDVYYIHSDHLNTPRLITDESGAVRWRWDAEPFGSGAPNEDPSGVGAFEFHLRFPGQVYFAETGLYYNYHRDYDPAVGRYVQSDPIGLAGGINTYAYVGSDPISAIDPTGENAVALGIRAYGIGSRIGHAINRSVEMSTGRSIGTLIYDATHPQCPPNDCPVIEAEIASTAAELRSRYFAALQDAKDLYTRARTTPFARRAGSWTGHRQQFMDKQAKLRKLIALADSKGCQVLPDDRMLSNAPFPDSPLPL